MPHKRVLLASPPLKDDEEIVSERAGDGVTALGPHFSLSWF
jgi:hypothetical protein